MKWVSGLCWNEGPLTSPDEGEDLQSEEARALDNADVWQVCQRSTCCMICRPFLVIFQLLTGSVVWCVVQPYLSKLHYVCSIAWQQWECSCRECVFRCGRMQLLTHTMKELFNCGQCRWLESVICEVFLFSTSTTDHVTCACTIYTVDQWTVCCVCRSCHVSHWYCVLCCIYCVLSMLYKEWVQCDVMYIRTYVCVLALAVSWSLCVIRFLFFRAAVEFLCTENTSRLSMITYNTPIWIYICRLINYNYIYYIIII